MLFRVYRSDVQDPRHCRAAVVHPAVGIEFVDVVNVCFSNFFSGLCDVFKWSCVSRVPRVGNRVDDVLRGELSPTFCVLFGFLWQLGFGVGGCGVFGWADQDAVRASPEAVAEAVGAG